MLATKPGWKPVSLFVAGAIACTANAASTADISPSVGAMLILLTAGMALQFHIATDDSQAGVPKTATTIGAAGANLIAVKPSIPARSSNAMREIATVMRHG